MSDNFHQTVNLREKMEQEKLKAQVRAGAVSRPVEKPVEKKEPAAPRRERNDQATSSVAIEEVFKDESKNTLENELQKISRPKPKIARPAWIKPLVITLVIAASLAGAYFFLIRGRLASNAPVKQFELKWYAVTLTDAEMYYGQIGDTKANPVEIAHVYYNYDQINKNSSTTEEVNPTGNLRLVKRGQETYGPSGAMLIYQAQIKTVDELSVDSKVLKAILEYEKK